MAENEYLDASKARRWQSVAQAIREDCSVPVVADKIEDCLYKMLRQIRKDLPLEDLIKCLDNRERLQEMCHLIDGAHDVKGFLIEAADRDTNLQGKLSYFLSWSLDNCLYDVPYLAAESVGSVSITEARNIVSESKTSVHKAIQRIAGKLAETPGWLPRKASRRDASLHKVDITEKMLGESLL